MFKISYAPEKLPILYTSATKKIFLAGSIEMGKAELWQDKIIDFLCHVLKNENFIIFNPRRKDWDSSWDDKDAKMHQQINWELSRIVKNSTIVFFYFDPNTKSPISLLELGIVLGKEIPAIVVCPNGFWKKNNVVETCNFFNVPVYDSIEIYQDNVINSSTTN